VDLPEQLGSSSSTSSLIGLRISASSCAVCTRVYFSSEMKNSTSSTGIIWICWPTVAWIHCSVRRRAAGCSWRASSCSSCCSRRGGRVRRCAARAALR
jgi:hypothetical protein